MKKTFFVDFLKVTDEKSKEGFFIVIVQIRASKINKQHTSNATVLNYYRSFLIITILHIFKFFTTLNLILISAEDMWQETTEASNLLALLQ